MVYRDADMSASAKQALDGLSLLTGKWRAAVLVVLAENGPVGFNQLSVALPDISGKVLSDTLEALQDAGLVERRVVSESPLRVEYALTETGADLKPVFAELEAWAETHLETATPTIVVAETDRRITQMYAGWLSDRYTVIRAHDTAELETAVLNDVDVLLFARRLTGISSDRVIEMTTTDCRTVLLVDGRPAFDVFDIPCDDVLAKPLVKETVLEAIERQLNRQGESERERTQNARAAKCALFEETYAPAELDANERYAEAQKRLD